MIVLSGGFPYDDIDVVGCLYAYSDFLDAINQKHAILLTAKINGSVPSMLKILMDKPLVQDVKSQDELIIFDVSDPDFFEPSVNPDQVVRIFDHHPGDRELWVEKLGHEAVIEDIGAACSLVSEFIEKQIGLDCLNQNSIKLLMAGILDNTLDFKAAISHERDMTM